MPFVFLKEPANTFFYGTLAPNLSDD